MMTLLVCRQEVFLFGPSNYVGCNLRRWAVEKTTITSKTLFWLTSRGRVVLTREPKDFGASIFRLEQLISGKEIQSLSDWNWPWPPVGFLLTMDDHGRILLEHAGPRDWHEGINEPLPARQRKVKVIADNLSAFAKMFGARYDNSLYE